MVKLQSSSAWTTTILTFVIVVTVIVVIVVTAVMIIMARGRPLSAPAKVAKLVATWQTTDPTLF